MSYDIKILIVIKLFTSVCYLQKLLLPRTVYISNGNLYRFVPWMSTRISLTLFSFTCLIPLPLSTIRSVSEKIAKGKGLKIAYLRMSLYKNLYTYDVFIRFYHYLKLKRWPKNILIFRVTYNSISCCCTLYSIAHS